MKTYKTNKKSTRKIFYKKRLIFSLIQDKKKLKIPSAILVLIRMYISPLERVNAAERAFLL